MNADTAPAGSSWTGRIRNATIAVLRAPAGSSRARRIRNATIAVLALVVTVAILGFFVVPPVVKSKLESYVAEATGRKATLGKVEFNPFTLRGKFTDFTLADREPDRTLFRFDTLDVDVSLATLWRRAPVFNAVHLVRPRVDLVRNADGKYNIQDLIDAMLARPAGPTPPFSINNIEIDDGAVYLDDRLHRRKVAVTNLGVGIPFLSSLPHDAEIRVNPRFEGALDGTHFALMGTTSTPFADSKEASLEVDFDALLLPDLVAYAPLPQGLTLKDGALTTRLKLSFVSEKGEPRTLTLSGTARLDRLSVTRPDGSTLVAARSIDATLAKLDPLGRTVALERLSVESPEIDLRRGADGSLEFERLLATNAGPTGAGAAPTARATAAPWTASVADLRVGQGTVRVADEAVSPAFRVALSNVKVEAQKLASNAGVGAAEVAFDSEEGAHFGASGEVDIAKGAARGHFSLTKFRLAKLYPYYAQALNLDVRRGLLDFTGDFDAAWSGAAPQLTLARGAATLSDLELAVRGEHDPLWRVSQGDLDGIAFDLAMRTIAIDRVEARPLALNVIRQADGVVNFERLVPTSAPASGTGNTAAPSGGEWSVVVRKLLFERMAADFEDRVPQPPVKLRISDARIAAENFGNVHGAKSTIDFTARIGSGGRAHASGPLVAQPFAIDWRLEANAIDLAPLRPYFESKTNLIVTGGALTVRGRLTVTGVTESPAAGFAGDVTITDFGSLDRPTSQELVRWKSLTLTGVNVATTPRKVGLGSIALDQFYARLIVNPDATLNLQRLLAPETNAEPAPASPPPAEQAPQELPVSIDRIQVSHGEVQFSDFYIKPNYSAHLTDVSGSVSALSATQAGDVELAARLADTAPVDIRGSLNPFARDLALDLTAKATDIDLPPLTPYSEKYAGYGITKGTLSFEVHYQIDKRKLVAANKLTLDQLTFGERVQSPTATKLPLLLAVALLKDRNGMIHLDLPIQGTLDDPKFSVWGVIVQIVVNLIAKAATAPFALLGAIAGGHAEELAFVEFMPGRAELSAPAEAKLQSLAKALADRPSLKLDAAGRAIPDIDRDGLKRVALDRALRVQKQKSLVSAGESAPPLDTLTIDATEYAKYLAAVYSDTKLPDKPRNVIGIAKDIPPAEMEALLLSSYGVDDEALRNLANRRAATVKEWFVEKGAIAPERVFVVAPKLTADGIQDKGAPTRVDFAIR